MDKSGFLRIVGPGLLLFGCLIQSAEASPVLAVDPADAGTIYHCGSGVETSRDFGQTWTRSNDDFVCRDIVTAPDGLGGHYIYAAAYQMGVLRSSDGINWSDSAEFAVDVYSLAASADGSIVYAGGEENVFVSRDYGQTWDLLPGLQGQGRIYAMAVDPQNPNVIYAFKSGTGVVRSTDGGVTWLSAAGGLDQGAGATNQFAIHPGNSSVLYIATSNGLWHSVDAGANWRSILDLYFTQFNTVAIDPADPDRLIAATDYSGIWYSFDGGQLWDIGLGDQSRVIEHESVIFTSDNSGIAYATSSRHGVLISRDSGATWLTGDGEVPNTNPEGNGSGSGGNVSLSIMSLQESGSITAGTSARFRVTFRNSEIYSLDSPIVLLNWAENGNWNVTSFTVIPSQGSCDGGACSLGSVGPDQSVTIEFAGSTTPGLAATYELEASHQSSYLPIIKSATVSTTVPAGQTSGGNTSGSGGGGGAMGLPVLLVLFLIVVFRIGKGIGSTCLLAWRMSAIGR